MDIKECITSKRVKVLTNENNGYCYLKIKNIQILAKGKKCFEKLTEKPIDFENKLNDNLVKEFATKVNNLDANIKIVLALPETPQREYFTTEDGEFVLVNESGIINLIKNASGNENTILEKIKEKKHFELSKNIIDYAILNNKKLKVLVCPNAIAYALLDENLVMLEEVDKINEKIFDYATDEEDEVFNFSLDLLKKKAKSYELVRIVNNLNTRETKFIGLNSIHNETFRKKKEEKVTTLPLINENPLNIVINSRLILGLKGNKIIIKQTAKGDLIVNELMIQPLDRAYSYI